MAGNFVYAKAWMVIPGILENPLSSTVQRLFGEKKKRLYNDSQSVGEEIIFENWPVNATMNLLLRLVSQLFMCPLSTYLSLSLAAPSLGFYKGIFVLPFHQCQQILPVTFYSLCS